MIEHGAQWLQERLRARVRLLMESPWNKQVTDQEIDNALRTNYCQEAADKLTKMLSMRRGVGYP